VGIACRRLPPEHAVFLERASVRIRLYCKRERIEWRPFAQRCGVGRQTVLRLVHGGEEGWTPTLLTIIKVATELGFKDSLRLLWPLTPTEQALSAALPPLRPSRATPRAVSRRRELTE
jgi:transcriptional regulator with XRE-family HTH domain